MATRVVQRHGRRYTLQIIRWLASLITDLADLAVDTRRLDAFFGLKEAFEIFLTDEKYLINRKVLSIYAR